MLDKSEPHGGAASENAAGSEPDRIIIAFVTASKLIGIACIQRERRPHCELPPLPGGDQPQKRRQAIEQIRRESAAELERARSYYNALGYGVFDVRADSDNLLRGFLVIGVVDCRETSEDIERFVFGIWNQSLPEFKNLDFTKLNADVLRGVAGTERDDDFFVKVDLSEHYDADEDDSAQFHPDDVRWWIKLPKRFRVEDGDSNATIISRLPSVAFTNADLQEVIGATSANLDMMVILLMARRAAAGHFAADFAPQILNGLIMAAEVTLWVGEGASGKSTIAHQIAAGVSAGVPEILGYEVAETAHGRTGVLLSAEESPHTIRRRIHLFAQHGLCGDVLPIARPLGGLAEVLRSIESMPGLGLVVVDPARAWLDGKEDDSEVVSRFLSMVQDFARRTGAAVVVIHHTKRRNLRDAPRTPVEVVSNVRGSQVWMDRPRVVIGMLRKRDGTTEVGVVKSNSAHSVPIHTARLRFDPASELHHRIGDAEDAARRRDNATGGGDAATIATCARRVVAEGGMLRKSGERGPFALKPPELGGWSRKRMDDAIRAALGCGLLADDKVRGLVCRE